MQIVNCFGCFHRAIKFKVVHRKYLSLARIYNRGAESHDRESCSRIHTHFVAVMKNPSLRKGHTAPLSSVFVEREISNDIGQNSR